MAEGKNGKSLREFFGLGRDRDACGGDILLKPIAMTGDVYSERVEFSFRLRVNSATFSVNCRDRSDAWGP